jgi:hypothetical protein
MSIPGPEAKKRICNQTCRVQEVLTQYLARVNRTHTLF